jgi:hypothetical protein
MSLAFSRVMRLMSIALIACGSAGRVLGQAEGIAGRSFGSQAQAGPTGSVSGTVIDQDTQRPVRLANISLQPIASSAQDSGQRRGFGVGGVMGGFVGGGGGGRSGLDGTFLMEGVAPGDYYVVASVAGFVPERALLQAQINAGATAEDVLRQVPTVHVSGNSAASVVVSVQHGGAISGRVQWEDGSAATGVQMSAQPVVTPVLAQGLPGGASFSRDNSVDDRGDFRVAGLVAGDYILSALVVPVAGRSGPVFPIHVYAPGVFRRSEATPVSVRTGDERGDVRMVIRLNGLHTVSGTVGAASGSASVKSGSVSLVDSVDSTLRLGGRIASDGSFSVKYVPPGTYTMTVQGSSQEAQAGYRRGGGGGNGNSGSGSDAATTFAPLTQPLQVGSTDVTGMSINLAVAAAR